MLDNEIKELKKKCKVDIKEEVKKEDNYSKCNLIKEFILKLVIIYMIHVQNLEDQRIRIKTVFGIW